MSLLYVQCGIATCVTVKQAFDKCYIVTCILGAHRSALSSWMWQYPIEQMANFPPLTVVTDMYMCLTCDRFMREYDNFEYRFAMGSDILGGDIPRMSTIEAVFYWHNMACRFGSESRQPYNISPWWFWLQRFARGYRFHERRKNLKKHPGRVKMSPV